MQNQSTAISSWEKFHDDEPNIRCQIDSVFFQTTYYKSVFVEKTRIGKGGFGQVFHVQNKYDDEDYALKKILIKGDFNEHWMLREVKVWAKLDNKFIVRYKSSWIENGDWIVEEGEQTRILENQRIFYIQMELCTMTLRTAMNRINKELDQDIQKGVTIIGAYISTEIFSEILEGVNYLHSQKPPILHRDLKMSNILFTNGKSGNFIKLSDFGLSTIHGAEINDSDVSEKIDINLKHSQNRGTFKYMAEEVKKGKYDTSADVFSLGVILCELLCIDSKTSPNFKDVHRRDNRYYPLNQIKVINMLLQEWASKRPSCDKLLASKQEWAINFDEIKFSSDLRDIFFHHWENQFDKKFNKNNDRISALVLTSRCHEFVRENLRTQYLFEKDLTKRNFNQYDISKKALSKKVHLVDQRSNIIDEKLKKTILKVVLHSLNICGDFDELCFFIEEELNKTLSMYWHCFTTSTPSFMNILNWYDYPEYNVAFVDEYQTLILQIIIFNTPVNIISDEALSKDLPEIKVPFKVTFSDEMIKKSSELTVKAINERRPLREIQNLISEGLKQEFKNHDWHCYVTQNELITCHSVFPLPENYFALRFWNYCILIVDRKLETMDSNLFESEDKVLSQMTSNDITAIKEVFTPQLINSAFVLKQVTFSYDKICFIRLFDYFGHTKQKYINYKLHFYNVQILWTPQVKNPDLIACEAIEQEVFRRHYMSEDDLELDLAKLASYSIDESTPANQIEECLKTFRKLLANNVFVGQTYRNYTNLFEDLMISLLKVANKYLMAEKSKIYQYRNENSQIQYMLLQTLDYYIKKKKDSEIDMIASNLIENYVKLLNSEDDNVCFYAVSAFNGILKHCSECYKKCFSIDLITPLSKLVEPTKSLALINAISSILPDLVDPNNDFLTKGQVRKILGIVNILLDHINERILTSMITTLRLLQISPHDNKSLIVESETIPKLVQLLEHQSKQIRDDSFTLLGVILLPYLNIRSIRLFADMFNCQIYENIKDCLNGYNNNLKGCALLILVLILFEKKEHIQPIIDADLIPALINMINKGNFKCMILAIKALNGMIKVSSEEQLSHFYSNRAVEALSTFLSACVSDEDCVGLCVVCLNILLTLQVNCKQHKAEILREIENNEVLTVIEPLKSHNDANVRQYVTKFFKVYQDKTKLQVIE